MQPDEQKLQEIVRRIVKAVQSEKIILFGSAARGEMGRNSDLDILVVKSGVHRRDTAVEIHRNLKGIGYSVDVVVAHPEDIERYGDSPALVFREALSTGTLLYAA